MFEDDYELSSDASSSSRSLHNSSDSGPSLPETPLPSRRKDKLLGQPRSNSNPLLISTPKPSLFERGSSEGGIILSKTSRSSERPLNPSAVISPKGYLSDDGNTMSPSFQSIRITSPLHMIANNEESPRQDFFPPNSASSEERTDSARSGSSGGSQNIYVQSETLPNYCPHPNTITTTTRGMKPKYPPKGWSIVNEAGIVVGSAAAYHGDSVSRSSTKAMSVVVSTLNEARNVATQNMLKAASHRGCNAVIAVKFDTSSPVPEVLLVTSYGTACVISKDQP